MIPCVPSGLLAAADARESIMPNVLKHNNPVNTKSFALCWQKKSQQSYIVATASLVSIAS